MEVSRLVNFALEIATLLHIWQSHLHGSAGNPFYWWMDITRVVAAVCMSADKCLMPRKICFGIFHANSLCLLPGQTMIGNIHGIVADNVMVAWRFEKGKQG